MQEKVLLTLLILSICGIIQANINGFHQTNHSHTEAEVKTKLKAQANEDHIFIHLLPHTHDDVGWLKTVDMYYSGSNQQTQWAEVHLILDSTIEQLLKDPSRKFTYVEMKFFSMWWKYQTDETKNNVRMLVSEGRLEFVNAGWSMHDEACTHYEDMIDNMMYGQQWLMDELGVAPRIGWHVDPFGHSSANARLFADMGLDAWFFARLDYQDKDQRMEDQSLQFIWQPFYDHLGETTQIFTGVMQDHYCWPNGFWYDERFMGDDPVVIDEKLTTFNADVKIQEMHDYAIMQMAPHYKGNHIMIPMGCDFSYANANINFKNMDRLMSYFNSHYDDATLIYSTPSDYLNAIIDQDLTFPVKYDDMFPYADQAEDFWTGYFTSRANSKRQVRVGQGNLISSGKLYSEKFLEANLDSDQQDSILSSFKQTMDAMGVYQHHDGVSGTAKQYVADDYTYKLFLAMESNNGEFTSVINEHMEKETGITASKWEWCYSSNDTYLECPIADNKASSFLIAAHNPGLLGRDYLKVKVPHGNYRVQQINPSTKSFDDLKAAVICMTRTGGSQLIHDCEMHINLQMEGDSLSYLAVTYDKSVNLHINPEFSSDALFIESSFEKITFQQFTSQGAVFNFLKRDGVANEFNVAFDVRFYFANQGGDGYPNSDNCPSGAYIFKPAKQFQDSQRYANLVYLAKYDGDFVQEFHMIFENRAIIEQSALVKMRVYKNLPISEWDVTLNGIPDDNKNGMEVTMNWMALEIDNEDVFYTDSNGLEMQKRELDYRPTWDYSSNQKVSGNYYPVNSAIAIRDENTNAQMTVMNDRSQGGTVMETGRIELMQNRRVYYDDYRGVGEALNERDSDGQPIVVQATYFLHIFDRNEEDSYQRPGQMLMDEPVQVFFSFEEDVLFTIDGLEQSRANPLSDIVTGDSKLVPLKYSVFPVSQNKIRVRLAHIGDKFDIPNQTVYVKVKDLGNYLWTLANGNTPLNGINIVEQTLSGNQAFADAQGKKTDWTLDSTVIPPSPPSVPQDRGDFEVGLQQQRIRMFELTFEPLSLLTEFENQ